MGNFHYTWRDATGEPGLKAKRYAQFTRTHSSGKFMLYQVLESSDSMPLRGENVTFQAKVKGSTNMTFRMGIAEVNSDGTLDAPPAPFVTSWNGDGVDPTFASGLTVSVASVDVTDSWDLVGVTHLVHADAKNIIPLLYSYNAMSPDDEFAVTELGLFHAGNFVKWQPNPLVQELAACQRRFWKSFPLPVKPLWNAGLTGAYRFSQPVAGAVTAQIPALSFPVRMRVTPIITLYNPSNTNSEAINVTANEDCSDTTATASEWGVSLRITGASGGAAGDECAVHLTANAEF